MRACGGGTFIDYIHTITCRSIVRHARLRVQAYRAWGTNAIRGPGKPARAARVARAFGAASPGSQGRAARAASQGSKGSQGSQPGQPGQPVRAARAARAASQGSQARLSRHDQRSRVRPRVRGGGFGAAAQLPQPGDFTRSIRELRIMDFGGVWTQADVQF